MREAFEQGGAAARAELQEQVEALVALLDGLGQTTNENEYIALSEFLESAGLTANELEQTLQSMGLDMAGLVGALKESRSGFSDLINAYAVILPGPEQLPQLRRNGCDP